MTRLGKLTYFTLLLSTAYTTWGVAEERDVCLLHVGMPGQEGCCTGIVSLDSVNPGVPGASSCCAATESCVVCTLSWVVDWRSAWENTHREKEDGTQDRRSRGGHLTTRTASMAEWLRRPPRERKVPGSNPLSRLDFSGVESYQRLKTWHSSGYPARRLAL